MKLNKTGAWAIAVISLAAVAVCAQAQPMGGPGKVEQSGPTPAGPIPMLSPPPQAGPEEIARNSRPIPYQIQPDNRVTFRLKGYPLAAGVLVQGDWPGGIGGHTAIQMTKDAQGFWTATTLAPLGSDVWSYSFNVDGFQVDPNWGQTNSPPSLLAANTFVIPGAFGSDFIPRGAPRGSLVYATIPFMGATKDLEIFLPPGYYEHPERRYPVLYLTLGGAGEPGQQGESPQSVMFENMFADGRAVPMIVVSLDPGAPGGDSVGWAGFNGAGNQTSDRYVVSADTIGTSLVDWVDHSFRTLADRDHRAIGGFSSAGAQGFMAGARHVDRFSTVFTFSGGYPTWPGVGVQIKSDLDPSKYEGPDLDRVPDMAKLATFIPELQASAHMKLVAIYVGAAEPLIQTQQLMKKFFADRGLPLYAQENPGQIHDGRNIRISLHDLATRIFKN
ncbi:MAG TPA: alpha/beta hydrolase-fold protein [Caulobacteraceae bacterium]|nr:alpha/beta hydrolase-fold protein [Caulobacteraceae bacterium]